MYRVTNKCSSFKKKTVSNNGNFNFHFSLNYAYIVHNLYSFHKNNKKGNELNKYVIRHSYTKKKHLPVNFVISLAEVLEKNILTLFIFSFFFIYMYMFFPLKHVIYFHSLFCKNYMNIYSLSEFV